MGDCLPFSALLSQALVAFAIEFDNEFEHQTPHRTTTYGSAAASTSVPWLVSMTMWFKFMQFVPEDGITVREFKRLAGLRSREMKIWLTRLTKWWDYLIISAQGDPSDWVIHPTPGGKKALQVWRPLSGMVEKRWQERFGKGIVDGLFRGLRLLTDELNPQLPDSLPVLGYDLFSPGPDPERDESAKGAAVPAREYALPTLLSKVLLAFAIKYERKSRQSIAISANVLRLAKDDGTRIRDLPRLSGVSKEAIAMAVKRVTDGGLAIIHEERTASRAKVLSLTVKGQQVRDTYYRLTRDLENDWKASFGPVVVGLRQSLECLAGEARAGQSRLFQGLEPYPDNWRAAVPSRHVLPHYPMILHRGGFPDGS